MPVRVVEVRASRTSASIEPAFVLVSGVNAHHRDQRTVSTVVPGANRSGVKMTLPSVNRIWLFSMASVPGWDCFSSRLKV